MRKVKTDETVVDSVIRLILVFSGANPHRVKGCEVGALNGFVFYRVFTLKPVVGFESVFTQ